MKIRIMGTKDECNFAKQFYRNYNSDPNLKFLNISDLYANRNSTNQFRIYIEIEFKNISDVKELKA